LSIGLLQADLVAAPWGWSARCARRHSAAD